MENVRGGGSATMTQLDLVAPDLSLLGIAHAFCSVAWEDLAKVRLPSMAADIEAHQ